MLNIETIYEDDNILAINKPAGLVMHPSGHTQEYTLTDWVLKKYPAIKNVGEPLFLQDGTIVQRHGIVHRLDRDTSGVVIVAKNQNSFEYLKKQFQDKKIQKTYRAILLGVLKRKTGIIDFPIGKSKKDFRRWVAKTPTCNNPSRQEIRGVLRESVTEFKVLNIGDKTTHIEIYPKTGRTHQIRVHFKAVGFPVLCDPLYGYKKGCFLGIKRQALHALKITLKNQDGSTITLETPPPKDFTLALDKMGVC